MRNGDDRKVIQFMDEVKPDRDCLPVSSYYAAGEIIQVVKAKDIWRRFRSADGISYDEFHRKLVRYIIRKKLQQRKDYWFLQEEMGENNSSTVFVLFFALDAIGGISIEMGKGK